MMRNLHKFLVVIAALILMFTPEISAADDVASPKSRETPKKGVTLPEVVVSGKPGESGVMVSQPQPTPRSSITKEGIELLGGPGQTNIYTPLELMPSVVVGNSDPYGMDTRGNINIRGKSKFHMTTTVEDLPLSGVVGGAFLFDQENVEQIDLYRGGLPANRGLGVSNASGTVNQKLLGPREKWGAVVKQSIGSNNFFRTFFRLDTGVLPSSGTSAFISGSTSAADKWTGVGDASRHNATLGVSQQFSDRLKIDFYAVYDEYKGNRFRSLSYAQTQDISTYYTHDYNQSLTGISSVDVNYYKFNRVKYENYAFLAKADLKLSERHHVLIKPYYWDDNGAMYSARGSNVQIWSQDNHNAGGVLEYQGRYGSGLQVIAGYWLQSMSPPPPPDDQKLYSVGDDGNLRFAKWATLAKIDDYRINSPYVQLTQTIGNTVLSGGVRYMNLRTPKMQYYETAGLPDASYDDVWKYNPTPNLNATVAAKDYNVFLPNVGIHHNLTSAWSVSLSYGRKFGRPDWGPQASNYIRNESAFVAQGITLQSLVDRVKLELSDQVDLSVGYKSKGLSAVVTVFGSKNRNRQVMVVDPALGGLSYYEGTADTTAYGLELEGEYKINDSWLIFGSFTLASETYDNNTPVLSGGAELATSGKQIPNTPNLMVKGGMIYCWRDLTISTIVRYMGKRYGDSIETQQVDDYLVFDLNAGYRFSRNILLSLSILNLFDQRYINQINPSDTNLDGSTSYYAGAPLTIAATLKVEF